jgi:hypothetical protein
MRVIWASLQLTREAGLVDRAMMAIKLLLTALVVGATGLGALYWWMPSLRPLPAPKPIANDVDGAKGN